MPAPVDYEKQLEREGNTDLPESSGTLLDRFFWWGWRHAWPQWLQGDEPFAQKVLDYLWIDCPWCLGMRFAFLSAIPSLLIGFGIGLLF